MVQQFIALTATKGKCSISLRGKIENIGSEKLDDIFEKNTYMQGIYPRGIRSALEVFRLYEAQGEYFDISDPFHILRESIEIGNAEVVALGYYVGSGCIGCGKCAEICPQKCIRTDNIPVLIDQSHCLHCGACFENGPSKAVIKRG